MDSKTRLLRRIHNIDGLVDYRLERYINLDVCDVTMEGFFGIISEWVIETMYYDYFGDVDDLSEEWTNMYRIMLKYLNSVHRKKIEDFYITRDSYPCED
jgi:hypothetical protein